MTPKSESLPMKAKGSSGLNTVVSPPMSRAMPRTAVSEPSVTMKGGSLRKAISTPFRNPKSRPVRMPGGNPQQTPARDQ